MSLARRSLQVELKIKRIRFYEWWKAPACKIHCLDPSIRDEVLLAFETWTNNGIKHISTTLGISRYVVNKVIDERYSSHG